MTDSTEYPLVSCIMPTYNRRRFVPKAIEYFLRQDYCSKELVIVDDGTDAVKDLVPADDRIRYIRLERKLTVGAKRNIACEHSQGGIIAHWDDDDWHAPHRLHYQVDFLLESGADLCGINTLLFYDIRTDTAWLYKYPSTLNLWLSGSSLCYRRSFWESNRFVETNVGEDGQFVWGGNPQRMAVLPDHRFHVGIIHDNNISPKHTNGPYWMRVSDDEVHSIVGFDRVRTTIEPIGDSAQPSTDVRGNMTTERKFETMTAARQADLSLPEFGAFNYGQSLPWMRRWELPYALFQARLADTMSVLDCTINPVIFQDRLTKLYPHVLYRHWNPIQNKQFLLPIGVPDGAFDRVICINSLEHLLRSQRNELIAAITRALKPGGLFIVTCDYYFDSAWNQEDFLKIGVMRADRQEVFNGWNKVSLIELADHCRENDLHPMGDTINDPSEHDPGLFLNQPPHPHACIAGVFFKSPQPLISKARRVVLALLTWNTKSVSMDSVRAHLREARMLHRLGQVPCICICDNGSTDGTPEALKEFEAEIDVPHYLILNSDNIGNSIARNQIIDKVLEFDADYVLFMDGDIEIVPFSSFAMMRYMESNGHRLGCIGADSGWQTRDRHRASKFIYSVQDFAVEETNIVAWTQYGMFRKEVFSSGVRFDEREPFNSAGWGFEDNDFGFQMYLKGFVNRRFTGMTYLHREARSSVRIMRQHGIDVRSSFIKRRDYLINKWGKEPLINGGPLEHIRCFNWIP